MDAVDYLRVSLDLTPREYQSTSRDSYETALLYQDARRRGIEDARKEHRRRDQDAKHDKDAIEALKREVGG